MSLTILQMVQRAEAELGLAQSTTAFGTTADVTGAQMGALANRVLDELRRTNPAGWTCQQIELNVRITPPLVTTGDMVAGSNVITGIPDTSTITPPYDFVVAGAGIPTAARVASVDSSTQVTMNMYNTNSDDVSGVTLTFARDTYDIPVTPDWSINRTWWDRTNHWELLGPDSPQVDQWHRSGIVTTGPRRHFRYVTPLFNPQIRLWPPPFEIVDPIQISFEVNALESVVVNGVTTLSLIAYAQYFANDADICLLDDNAIITGIKWLFWEAKGFGSYVTMQQRWVDYVERLIARDGGAKTLSLTRNRGSSLLSPGSVQDGFYPGPTGPNTG